MNINERIRFLRKEELHTTQESFGEPLGLTRANIANIEAGRISVTERVIIGIRDKYGISESWLRDGIEPMRIEISRDEEISKFVGTVLASEEESFKKRFIQMLSQLDENDWKALKKMSLLMAKKSEED